MKEQSQKEIDNLHDQFDEHKCHFTKHCIDEADLWYDMQGEISEIKSLLDESSDDK